MATHTLGTNATTSLTAVTFSPVPSVLSDADMATIRAGIRSDDASHAVATLRGYGGFVREGLLYLPNNRGVIKLAPGDVVAIDTVATSGWPILLSAYAVANGPWTLSA